MHVSFHRIHPIFEVLQDGPNYVPKELEFPLHAAGISVPSEWITGREKTGEAFVEEGPPP